MQQRFSETNKKNQEKLNKDLSPFRTSFVQVL